MRKIALGMIALSFVATPALAQNSGDFASVDTDGNGEITLAEVQAAWPDITEAQFTAADTDLNGFLSDAEFDSLVTGSGEATEITGQPLSETDNDDASDDAGKTDDATEETAPQ